MARTKQTVTMHHIELRFLFRKYKHLFGRISPSAMQDMCAGLKVSIQDFWMKRVPVYHPVVRSIYHELAKELVKVIVLP
jgi:hypothetical protein